MARSYLANFYVAEVQSSRRIQRKILFFIIGLQTVKITKIFKKTLAVGKINTAMVYYKLKYRVS